MRSLNPYAVGIALLLFVFTGAGFDRFLKILEAVSTVLGYVESQKIIGEDTEHIKRRKEITSQHQPGISYAQEKLRKLDAESDDARREFYDSIANCDRLNDAISSVEGELDKAKYEQVRAKGDLKELPSRIAQAAADLVAAQDKANVFGREMDAFDTSIPRLKASAEEEAERDARLRYTEPLRRIEEGTARIRAAEAKGARVQWDFVNQQHDLKLRPINAAIKHECELQTRRRVETIREHFESLKEGRERLDGIVKKRESELEEIRKQYALAGPHLDALAEKIHHLEANHNSLLEKHRNAKEVLSARREEMSVARDAYNSAAQEVARLQQDLTDQLAEHTNKIASQ